jgi:hypothetical protein
MRATRLLGCFLIASSCVASLTAEEVIKDKSPDGKFALRLIHGEEGWDTEIIETATKRKVIDLENVALNGDQDRTDWMVRGGYQSLEDYGKDARRLWSNDSQPVAYFDESRHQHRPAFIFETATRLKKWRCRSFCDVMRSKMKTRKTSTRFGTSWRRNPGSTLKFARGF